MRADPFALMLLGGAAFCFFRAARAIRTGTADFYVEPGQGVSADKEDDPIGYSTAVWGNILMGVFGLFLAMSVSLS